MKIDYQEKIDDYVLGKMSAKDRGVFEKEVSQNKEMREQLELTQNVRDAIRSRQEKFAMMQKWENSRKVMAWASSVVGIAAVFAIGFFLFVPKSGDVELEIKETQVYKRIEYSQIYNDETLRENARHEELTEERFQYLEQKVHQFLDYMQCLQDGNLSLSVYEKALNFLMDSQLAKTLHKEEAKIIILSEHDEKQEMLLSQYLKRLKRGYILLKKIKKIELYEVDESSILEIEDGGYICDICTHVLFLEKNITLHSKTRETVEVDTKTIEALKKNGGVFIGKIETINSKIE